MARAGRVNEPLPVAVVGAGRVAHAVYLRLLPDLAREFKLVAVVETDQRRAHLVKAAYPYLLVTGDLELAVKAGARGAICATPWATHAQVVSECLDLGLAVLCEKPVSLDGAEISWLREREHSAGLPVAVGYMKRHDLAVTAFIEIARDWLGEARLMTVRIVDPNAPHQVAHLTPAGDLIPSSRTADAAEARIRRLLPSASQDVRTAYAHGLGGSLIHHVNLLNAVLEGSGSSLLGGLSHASQWDQGRSVSCEWQPSGTLTIQACHVRVPGHRRYREVVELVSEHGWAALALPSPYSRDHGARLEAQRWDGESGLSTRTADEAAPGQTGFFRQLLAWARSLRDGRLDRLPGLAEAQQDLAVVLEAAERLT